MNWDFFLEYEKMMTQYRRQLIPILIILALVSFILDYFRKDE